MDYLILIAIVIAILGGFFTIIGVGYLVYQYFARKKCIRDPKGWIVKFWVNDSEQTGVIIDIQDDVATLDTKYGYITRHINDIVPVYKK